jgi:hypothetical protein
MSLVEVRQIGHVAVAAVAEMLSVKDRSQTKVALTVISNARWKDAEGTLKEKRPRPLPGPCGARSRSMPAGTWV